MSEMEQRFLLIRQANEDRATSHQAGVKPEVFQGGITSRDQRWHAWINGGLTRADIAGINKEFSESTFEIHPRNEGERMSVVRPDGYRRTYTEGTIIYRKDPDGDIVGRWQVAENPDGFRVEERVRDKAKKWWNGTNAQAILSIRTSYTTTQGKPKRCSPAYFFMQFHISTCT